MKKEKKDKNKKYSKWIYSLFFILPLVITLMNFKSMDNDLWYLLSEGREIIQNGIYHFDVLSIHEGLSVTIQNWASASLLWVIYSGFGEMGLLFVILLINFFICLLIYKICNLISEENKILSLVVMFIADITLSTHFIVSRPQIFSFVLLLGVIYVLELYIKTKNWKYLIWLPILSIIEINMHASLWWMIFLFALPYVIDSFKIPFLKTEGYPRKHLLIFLGIALLCGFINPFGYKAITFIFGSYTNHTMRIYINELLPFSFSNSLGKHMFILTLAITLCYTYFRDGKTKVRYICLFAGTLILGFMSIKGFSHYILVSTFPMAYFFKDIFPRDLELDNISKKIIQIFVITLTIASSGFGCYLFITAKDKVTLKHDAQEAIDVLKNFDAEKCTVYSSFNNGGFVEFNGYKSYIDPRAEVFIKFNNKKADIFDEYYNLQQGKIKVETFIKKYNFTHLLVQNVDVLYNQMEDIDNYVVLYDDSEKGYRLYARSDLFSKEELEEIEKNYNDALEEAKAKEEEAKKAND